MGSAGVGPEPGQAIGQALVLLNQHMASVKRLAAHPVEHALQLGAVSAMRERAKFLRQMRNILTKFVHATPLD